MHKILTIVQKELYITFTNRTLLLIMIVTPLALATIISLAFSQFFGSGRNDVPIRNIPVILVNLDSGSTAINYGDIFTQALIPPEGATDAQIAENPLFTLTNTVSGTDADAARAAVEAGDYTAAIIIPIDFSQRLTIDAEKTTLEPTSVEVYASSALAVGRLVVNGIVDQLVNGIASGAITASASVQALYGQIAQDAVTAVTSGQPFTPPDGDAIGAALGESIAYASSTANNPLQVQGETVAGEVATLNPLVLFGSSLTIFFMMFTATGGAASMLEEKRDGTLDRLLISPTPRSAILLGKMLGTFMLCAFQLVMLIIALTVIGSLVAGEFQFIWGTQWGLIVLAVIATSMGAAGLGVISMSLVRTPEQANIVGGIVSMAMGLFGGAFFSVDTIPLLAPLSRFTVVWWGSDLFRKLSLNQTDILLNLVILLGLGVVMFVIGTLIFNRRMAQD
jgi:ABC-type transport system involved in multi-copper enzyme maturation permease subunit